MMDLSGHCAILCVPLAVVAVAAGATSLGIVSALVLSASLLTLGWALWHRVS